MGWPVKEAMVKSIGLAGPQAPGPIRNVELLGFKGKLNFKKDEAALRVGMSAEKISDVGITLKVELA
jgi:hypothetical protein